VYVLYQQLTLFKIKKPERHLLREMREEKSGDLVFNPSRCCHFPRLRYLHKGIDGSLLPLLTAPVMGGGGDLGPTLGVVVRFLKLQTGQPATTL
jgi:hypothetical protein